VALQNWPDGTQTGSTQHEFTKQISSDAQSESPFGQRVRPAQGVRPLTHRPPPAAVEPQTPLPPQVPPLSQVVNVPQVSPAHSGFGFEVQVPPAQPL